jgi:hypothetical protein
MNINLKKLLLFALIFFIASIGGGIGTELGKKIFSSPRSEQNNTSNKVMSYSDSELDKAGKIMSDGVSKSTPAQVDKTTVLLGTIYVKDTKTFIYKYESSITLDRQKMSEIVPSHTCSDPIRKSLMHKGMTFKHIYLTPSGEVDYTVNYLDCQQQ